MNLKNVLICNFIAWVIIVSVIVFAPPVGALATVLKIFMAIKVVAFLAAFNYCLNNNLYA